MGRGRMGWLRMGRGRRERSIRLGLPIWRAGSRKLSKIRWMERKRGWMKSLAVSLMIEY